MIQMHSSTTSSASDIPRDRLERIRFTVDIRASLAACGFADQVVYLLDRVDPRSRKRRSVSHNYWCACACGGVHTPVCWKLPLAVGHCIHCGAHASSVR